MYSIVRGMETYRIPKEQISKERNRLLNLERKMHGRIVAYAAVPDGEYYQMFVACVPAMNLEESNSSGETER